MSGLHRIGQRSTRRANLPPIPGGVSNVGRPFVVDRRVPQKWRSDITEDEIRSSIDLYPDILQEVVLDFSSDSITSEIIESWIAEKQEHIEQQNSPQIEQFEEDDDRRCSVNSHTSRQHSSREQASEFGIGRKDESNNLALYSERRISKLEIALLDEATTHRNSGSHCTLPNFNFDVIRKACLVLMNAVKADGLSIYLFDIDDQLYFAWSNGEVHYQDGQLDIAGSVASTKRGKYIDNIKPPNLLDDETDVALLSVPMLSNASESKVLAVVQYTRNKPWLGLFTEMDLQLANFLLCWLGIALCSIEENVELDVHNELNEYLVEAITEMFKNIDHRDRLLSMIMTNTKQLVKAERCGLVLVDQDKNELYAEMFDEGEFDDAGNSVYEKSKRVRFPVGKGIVGDTIATGKINNVPDASKDPRFFSSVDESTGFQTRQILCAPITSNNSNNSHEKTHVFGAVEAINKKNGRRFTEFDEVSLSIFAVYVGMAVNYSHVYNKMKRDVIMTEIAAEQLRYHIFLHCDEACRRFIPLASKPNPVPANFDRFTYYPPSDMSKEKLQELVHHMLFKRFGKDTFDLSSIILCVVLIRENYPYYPYHNWTHAFCASHFSYLFLDFMMDDIFTQTESLAIFLTSLAHDMNFRGYGHRSEGKSGRDDRIANCFSTPLGDLHHYHTLVHILKCNNIFRSLTANEYRQFLVELRENFEALDLEVLQESLRTTQELLATKTFDIKNASHRRHFKNLVIKACDLYTMFKDWRNHIKDILHVSREIGRTSERHSSLTLPFNDSIPKMSKRKVPTLVLAFMRKYVHPLVLTICEICPSCSPLITLAAANLSNWQTVVNGGVVEQWEQTNLKPNQ